MITAFISALAGRATKWLAGFTLTPQMIGVVAVLWLASLGGVWAYMEGHATSVAETAKAAALAECNADKAKAAEEALAAQAKAIREAREKWTKAQAEVDALAKAEREQMEADLVAARVRADNLFRNLMAHIHAKPLDPSCRFDAERVRLYNEARRSDSAGSD